MGLRRRNGRRIGLSAGKGSANPSRTLTGPSCSTGHDEIKRLKMYSLLYVNSTVHSSCAVTFRTFVVDRAREGFAMKSNQCRSASIDVVNPWLLPWLVIMPTAAKHKKENSRVNFYVLGRGG